jgi:hypothetical protein
VKHSRLLFGFIVFGIGSLAIFFVALYSNVALLENILTTSFPTIHIFWVLMFGGAVLLTIGVLGIGRQCFKDEDSRGQFTLITVSIIPLVLFALVMYVYSTFTFSIA